MNGNNKHINTKPGKTMGKISDRGFDDDMSFQGEDAALFGEISEFMRAQLDLEDVVKDPGLDKTRSAVKEMISDYNKTLTENSENRKFISDAFSDTVPEENIKNEISEIKLDIENSDVKDLTTAWVNEWHRKKQMEGAADLKIKEINDFITGSLQSEETEPAAEIQTIIKKSIIRPVFIRYASLAAACMIGVFLLIRTLLPSSDPGKLFISYYKPFNAISPVTRSSNSTAGNTYTSAIASYKSGDYQQAATGFSKSVANDPSFGSPRFFLGLTAIALGNYDQAISQLSFESDGSGEYGKEAQWYMGLAYLKSGNKLKASECFERLSQSDGFYREGSEKILRRLK